MLVKFERLFEVEIYHHYYAAKVSEDLVINPTADCRRLLRDYGLLLRTTPKGFVVLYEAYEDAAQKLHPRKPLEENVRLSFWLQPNNPYLINYSDLPLDSPSGHIYYGSNLNDNLQDSQLLLSADTGAEFLSPQDLLELKSQRFQYPMESPNFSAEIEIIDDFANIVIKETVVMVDGVANFPVDLRKYGSGKFTLKIDGIQKAQFYANDELIGQNVFGLIDIFRHDSVPVAYQFTDATQNHDVQTKAFVVKIANRQTFWKYFLVLKYRLKDLTPDQWPSDWPADWSIVYPPDPSVKIEPQPAAVKTLVDGTLAVPFVSDAKLPLQQAVILGLQLKKSGSNGNGSGIREIENLPNPSVASIVPNDSDGKIYSEIYVYV